MQTANQADDTTRYARRIEVAKHLRFDIDRDVVRGREFDFSLKFLPDGLSRVGAIGFLTETERRLLSQIQGRTYANMLAMLEHFIGVKMTEMSRDRRRGNSGALEALARITEEERKHQELFRRLDRMIGSRMAEGYVFVTEPYLFARAALARTTWAALALICQIEVSVLAHHRASMDGDSNVSPLYRDVFLHHAREESQHAILDTLEWAREDLRLDDLERDRAVDDLIALLGYVDGILQSQANADTEYFLHVAKRAFDTEQVLGVRDALLAAYHGQFIVTGVREPRFAEALGAKLKTAQADRLRAAVVAIVELAK